MVDAKKALIELVGVEIFLVLLLVFHQSISALPIIGPIFVNAKNFLIVMIAFTTLVIMYLLWSLLHST
jgi:hypothetical protein